MRSFKDIIIYRLCVCDMCKRKKRHWCSGNISVYQMLARGSIPRCRNIF